MAWEKASLEELTMREGMDSMTQNENCPCKKKKCERHGKCDECRKHHAESKRPRPCERQPKSSVLPAILVIFLIMITLQGIRELAEYLISPNIPDTRFAGKMLTMTEMIVLIVLLLTVTQLTKQRLSVFPTRFSKGYIIATCVVVALYITTPANYIVGFQVVLVLFYGSIVTPVYEELLFRGLFWNWCKKYWKNERTVYVWNVLFFTVWHLGYMVPNLVEGNWNAVLWKLAAGLGYGIVLGLVRMKTKNCYACILVHGVLNLFMV